MFAELVNDHGVATVELDTLHRFEHDGEAAASAEPVKPSPKPPQLCWSATMTRLAQASRRAHSR